MFDSNALYIKACNSEKFLEHFDVESLFYNATMSPLYSIPAVLLQVFPITLHYSPHSGKDHPVPRLIRAAKGKPGCHLWLLTLMP